MKLILPIMCSLLLAGCSSNTDKSEISATVEPTVQASSSTPQPAIETSTESLEPKTVESTPTTVAIAPTVDGKAIYTQKCVSCHGTKGKKSALGKSQVIADFTEQQIKDALKGYQDGSYGKEMKGLMQGQVKSLELEQINALAQHITTL